MYTREELMKLAEKIVEEPKVDEMLMFADILEEIDDVRSEAVRKHCSCCQRGIGIIENFSYTGQPATTYEGMSSLGDDTYGKEAKDWPCM